MEENFIVIATDLAPLLLLLAGLGFTVSVDPYISGKHRGIMLVILLLAATLIGQNLWENALAEGPPKPLARTLLAIYGYTVRPVFLVLFLYLVQPGSRYAASWILVGVNWIVHMTALFSPVCFQITPENHYHPGPLGNTCLVISLALLANLLVLSIRSYRAGGKQEKLIPLIVTGVILLAVFLDGEVGLAEQPITFLTVAIVVGAMFYYIWLHLRFVREHEEDLKARQRIQLMLSQIQPHFLYNSLGAIRSTIMDDPRRARDAVDDFTLYLRHNMDSLTNDQPIPFTQELEHVRHFLALQQLRFEAALDVAYELDCTEFRLPTLSLQPIVENAVTYGVRKNPKGEGRVIIRTREYPDRWEVSVIDNGPGFVPESLPEDAGRSHIGIQNVRDRLRYSVGGDLQIHSVLGEGTTAVIILPKKKESIHADLRY